jgi:hypothetical protein
VSQSDFFAHRNLPQRDDMKLRLRQEDVLEVVGESYMKRFKANTIFDAELTYGVYFKTEVTKKFVELTLENKKYHFEEWEPGSFERTFEIL